MAIINGNGSNGTGGSGGGTGAGSIAEDMYFETIAERDAFTINNPDRIFQGVTCAVGNAPVYDYYQYDNVNFEWREANLIFQGRRGEAGTNGTNGTDGKDGVVQELQAGENVTIDSSDPTKPIISSSGGGFDPSATLSPNTIPTSNQNSSQLVDSPFKVNPSDNSVEMNGVFTATELKTSIASLNLGDEKKISGLGEGVEVHDLSRDRHKFIITQELDKDKDTKAFHYQQGQYALINIQPEFNTLITDPEFNITTTLGDQILYGFEVKVNETQNNCVAQIFRDGQDTPIWQETFDNVNSDELILGSPVVLDNNTTYRFKITGEFLGNAAGRMYYSIGARIASKQDFLDDSDRVNVDGVQNPNIVTGNGLTSEEVGGNIMLEISGKTDVIELDVSLDATREINNAYVGKVISLIQSGNPVAIPMQLTLTAHNTFETGDVIEIESSASYVNYYFAVYYYNANGAIKVVYPNNSLRLTRTDEGWNVQEDGRFFNVAIVPEDIATYSNHEDSSSTPAQVMVLVDNPAVSIITTDSGDRALKLDLNKIGGGGSLPTDPVFNSVTANTVNTPVIDTNTTRLTFDVSGLEVAHFTNNSLDLIPTVNNGSGFDVTGIYRLKGAADTSHIAIPNDNMVLYAEGTVAFQDENSDFLYVNRVQGLQWAGSTAAIKSDYDQNKMFFKGDKVSLVDISENDVFSIDRDNNYVPDFHDNRVSNVATPAQDKDATNKAYVDNLIDGLVSRIEELEATVSQHTTDIGGLTSNVISMGQSINEVVESNKQSVTNFVMYSETSDTLRMDMDRIGGIGLTQTIQLGNAPVPPNPEPPLPEEVTIYFGWDVNEMENMQADDFKNYQSTDERSANLYVTSENLLTTVIDITRSDTSRYKYSYIAYPKGLVDPDPYKVTYDGFTDSWEHREMNIDGHTYIVLVPEYPNINATMNMTLSY